MNQSNTSIICKTIIIIFLTLMLISIVKFITDKYFDAERLRKEKQIENLKDIVKDLRSKNK